MLQSTETIIKNTTDENEDIIEKFCPECLKRHLPEPQKVKMEIKQSVGFFDRYVCPECGYQE